MITGFQVWMLAFGVKLVLLAVFVFPKGEAFADRYDPLKQKQRYDDREYFQLAQRFAEHGTFGVHFGDPSFRSVFRTPGYTVVLAAIGSVSRWNPLVMLVVQSALFSLLPVVMLGVLRTLDLPHWPAAVLAIEPMTNVVSVTFMTEGLFCLLLLTSFLCFLKAGQNGFRLCAYLLLALAVLVKPSVQYFYVLAVLGGLVWLPRRGVTVAVVLLSLLPVGFWVLRNHAVTGQMILSTQTDNMVLAVPVMESVRTGVPTDDVIARIAREHAGRYEPMFAEYYPGHLSGLLRDNKFDFKEYTVAYLREHPVLFVRCHLSGMVQVMFGTMREHVRQVFFDGGKVPPMFQKGYAAVVLLFSAALYLFIASGFRPAQLWRPAYAASVLFVGYNLALIGVFAYLTGGGLKRVPFIPFLFVMAAFAAETWRRRMRERSAAREKSYGNA